MDLFNLLRTNGIKTSVESIDMETNEIGYSQYPEDYPKGSAGDKAIRRLLDEGKIRIEGTDKGFVILAAK